MALATTDGSASPEFASVHIVWNDISGVTPGATRGAGLRLRTAAPHPVDASGGSTIRFALPETADVDLALFDIQGRRLHTLASGRLDAGEHAVALGALARGLYLCRLQAVDGSASTKLIVD